MKRLFKYNNLMYTPLNFSLLPKTGRINNTKKSIGNDRLDTFIFTLKLYYDGYSVFLLSPSTLNYTSYKNHEILRRFLDSFKDVYEFCEYIYHIEAKKLVQRLYESGKTAINSPNRLE